MLSLKDFIQETLAQIMEGVAAADGDARKLGGMVNPNGLDLANKGMRLMQTGARHGQMIDFDVAVVSTESRETKGGIGVFLGPAGAGSAGQSGKTNEPTSRIRFSVPVILPGGPGDAKPE